MKYKLNVLAAFSASIEIDANSREEAFSEYDRLRERGKLPWRFVDTVDVNCDEITNNK